MPVPGTKDELRQAIDSPFALPLKKLETSPQSLAFDPVLEGHAKGSAMSVAHLVSYPIGWGAGLILAR